MGRRHLKKSGRLPLDPKLDPEIINNILNLPVTDFQSPKANKFKMPPPFKSDKKPIQTEPENTKISCHKIRLKTSLDDDVSEDKMIEPRKSESTGPSEGRKKTPMSQEPKDRVTQESIGIHEKDPSDELASFKLNLTDITTNNSPGIPNSISDQARMSSSEVKDATVEVLRQMMNYLTSQIPKSAQDSLPVERLTEDRGAEILDKVRRSNCKTSKSDSSLFQYHVSHIEIKPPEPTKLSGTLRNQKNKQPNRNTEHKYRTQGISDTTPASIAAIGPIYRLINDLAIQMFYRINDSTKSESKNRFEKFNIENRLQNSTLTSQAELGNFLSNLEAATNQIKEKQENIMEMSKTMIQRSQQTEYEKTATQETYQIDIEDKKAEYISKSIQVDAEKIAEDSDYIYCIPENTTTKQTTNKLVDTVGGARKDENVCKQQALIYSKNLQDARVTINQEKRCYGTKLKDNASAHLTDSSLYSLPISHVTKPSSRPPSFHYEHVGILGSSPVTKSTPKQVPQSGLSNLEIPFTYPIILPRVNHYAYISDINKMKTRKLEPLLLNSGRDSLHAIKQINPTNYTKNLMGELYSSLEPNEYESKESKMDDNPVAIPKAPSIRKFTKTYSVSQLVRNGTADKFPSIDNTSYPRAYKNSNYSYADDISNNHWESMKIEPNKGCFDQNTQIMNPRRKRFQYYQNCQIREEKRPPHLYAQPKASSCMTVESPPYKLLNTSDKLTYIDHQLFKSSNIGFKSQHLVSKRPIDFTEIVQTNPYSSNYSTRQSPLSECEVINDSQFIDYIRARDNRHFKSVNRPRIERVSFTEDPDIKNLKPVDAISVPPRRAKPSSLKMSLNEDLLPSKVCCAHKRRHTFPPSRPQRNFSLSTSTSDFHDFLANSRTSQNLSIPLKMDSERFSEYDETLAKESLRNDMSVVKTRPDHAVFSVPRRTSSLMLSIETKDSLGSTEPTRRSTIPEPSVDDTSTKPTKAIAQKYVSKKIEKREKIRDEEVIIEGGGGVTMEKSMKVETFKQVETSKDGEKIIDGEKPKIEGKIREEEISKKEEKSKDVEIYNKKDNFKEEDIFRYEARSGDGVELKEGVKPKYEENLFYFQKFKEGEKSIGEEKSNALGKFKGEEGHSKDGDKYSDASKDGDKSKEIIQKKDQYNEIGEEHSEYKKEDKIDEEYERIKDNCKSCVTLTEESYRELLKCYVPKPATITKYVYIKKVLTSPPIKKRTPNCYQQPPGPSNFMSQEYSGPCCQLTCCPRAPLPFPKPQQHFLYRPTVVFNSQPLGTYNKCPSLLPSPRPLCCRGCSQSCYPN